jgi:hypothetical protein
MARSDNHFQAETAPGGMNTLHVIAFPGRFISKARALNVDPPLRLFLLNLSLLC